MREAVLGSEVLLPGDLGHLLDRPGPLRQWRGLRREGRSQGAALALCAGCLGSSAHRCGPLLRPKVGFGWPRGPGPSVDIPVVGKGWGNRSGLGNGEYGESTNEWFSWFNACKFTPMYASFF